MLNRLQHKKYCSLTTGQPLDNKIEI